MLLKERSYSKTSNTRLSGKETSERSGIVISDTNILIYLSKYILKPGILINNDTAISVVTKIEALGFSFQNI
jgi:hypothetical protein